MDVRVVVDAEPIVTIPTTSSPAPDPVGEEGSGATEGGRGAQPPVERRPPRSEPGRKGSAAPRKSGRKGEKRGRATLSVPRNCRCLVCTCRAGNESVIFVSQVGLFLNNCLCKHWALGRETIVQIVSLNAHTNSERGYMTLAAQPPLPTRVVCTAPPC